MALTIDSRAVFRAIADHPEAFPAIEADLDEAARKLLIKQIKAKTTDVVLFKTIHEVVGDVNMSKILDGFAASDLSGLVKKIDPHSAHVGTTGDPKGVRSHLMDLATGRATPVVKPEKVVKAKVPRTPRVAPPKIGGILESKVHSGVKPKVPRTSARKVG